MPTVSELQQQLPLDSRIKPWPSVGLTDAYLIAKEIVIAAGYSDEIRWQESVRLEDVTESDFLAEHGYVALCSGMRQAVVRRKFPGIAEAFEQWPSAQFVVAHADACRERALAQFNHRGKIGAMIAAATIVVSEGFSRLKPLIAENALAQLRRFPYIGPVTVYHLAKNLGASVAKPDRHLVRIAEATGYDDVQTLCMRLSEECGDPVPVVDIVLWRFATL